MVSNTRYNAGTEDIGPDIICVKISRPTRWTRHVARMVERRVPTGIWYGDLLKIVKWNTLT